MPKPWKAFTEETANIREAPIGNASVLDDIPSGTDVRDAIQAITREPPLAERLSEPKNLPRLSKRGQWLTIDSLVTLATGTDSVDWNEFVDGDGRVNIKRGAGPARKLPASQLLAWFRGDPEVVKPRQTDLDGELVAQKDGAEYRIIQSVRHYFASGPYEAFVTKATLNQIKSVDMTDSRRLRIVDAKIRLKKEIVDDVADKLRGEHKHKILAIMLVAKPSDAEDAPEDGE